MNKMLLLMFLFLSSIISTGCVGKVAESVDPGFVNTVNDQFLAGLQTNDVKIKNSSTELIGNNIVFNISYLMIVDHKVISGVLGQPDRVIIKQGHNLLIDNVYKTEIVNDVTEWVFPQLRIIPPNTVDFIPVNVTLTIPYDSLKDTGEIYYTNTYFEQIKDAVNKKEIANQISIGIGYRKDVNNPNKILTKFIIELKPR